MFKKCDLCNLNMMPVQLKPADPVIDYCPVCDREKLPEKFRDKTYLEISIIELKETLSEKFKPIIDWLEVRNITVIHIMLICALTLAFIFFMEVNILNNINSNLINDNEILIEANESLLESNDYLIELNGIFIHRLYPVYLKDITGKDIVDVKILDSIFNKSEYKLLLEDSI